MRTAQHCPHWRTALAVFALWMAPATLAARGQDPGLAPSEEIEPRAIGRKGTTTIGFAGYLDRFFSPEEVLPGHYLVQADGMRFVTRRIAVRAGVAGTGTFAGDAEEEMSGPGAPALHGTGGALFYFTPQSLVSLYAGADYWVQLNRRAGRDGGVLFGLGGVHAAVSSRASVFVEAGMGAALTRGSEGERLTRLAGRIGLRIRL